MNFSSTNNLYGFPQPLTRVFPAPIQAQRAPTTADYKYPIGQSWIDEVGEDAYVLVNVAGNVATWNVTAITPGNVDTLTGDSGGAVIPSAGDIILAGTANQITSIGSGSTITFSLIGPYTPSTFTSHGLLVGAGTSSIAALAAASTGTVLAGSTGANPAFTASPSVTGSVTAGTTLTATLGAITATNGNLVLGTAGNKIVIATGSNASVGTSAAMSGTPGEVVVATTACSATAKVFYSRATTGGTPGEVSITAQDATGFTLTSTGNETSTFNWWIINA